MRYIKLLWTEMRSDLVESEMQASVGRKWEEKIILGGWTILQGKSKVGKELDALRKQNESQCCTRQVKRDKQAHVGDVGKESKCTELYILVKYIGKSWGDVNQKNNNKI